MADLLNAIEFSIPRTQRTYTFGTAEDVQSWLERELASWRELAPATVRDGNLRRYWEQQIGHFNRVQSSLAALASASPAQIRQLHQDLDSSFNQFRTGEALCSDSDDFPHLVSLWESSPEAAVLVLISSRPDGEQILGQFAHQFRFHTIIRGLVAANASEKSDGWLKPQRKEIAALKSDLERCRQQARVEIEQHKSSHSDLIRADKSAREACNKSWNEQLQQVKNDWERLIKTYDEAMAMAAPSTYWRDRAEKHNNQAISFGVAFGSVLTAALIAFLVYGLPYLVSRTEVAGGSVVLALVPILIPSFGVIWILKMLARLLGESLQLMRDAKERETMVKTFLAFVHDEERGKSLLLEQDRILILHALFRPSSINSTDDSPPVHWFDILSSKFSEKDRR